MERPPKKYVCEKCGYLGDTPDHEGCDYLAWTTGEQRYIDHIEAKLAKLQPSPASALGGTLNMSLEQQIANEHPNALNLLGMDRMIRRAYEAATSDNPSMTKVWHDAEVLAAERRRDLTPHNAE